MTTHRSNGGSYVVIGAGSAGAILASRLSEDATTHVTLLESGPDYRSADTIEAIRAVAMSPSLVVENLPDYFWLDLQARRSAEQEAGFYWRGKGVGGSSAINGQVAFRPPPEDFADWVELGCAGWDWDSVLPYFIRFENDLMFGNAPYHGTTGPIPVTRATEGQWSALDRAFRVAAERDGHFWAPDINAPVGTGCGYYPYNSLDGRRVSTNDGYLEPARGRDNLNVRAGVLVDHLLFDGDRAIGVRILDADGGVEEVYADQIVLAAGAVGSAAILMRSGIGPSEHLRDLGVSVRADLPVGDNVQDHANVSMRFMMEPSGDQGLYRPVCCVRFSTGLEGRGRNDAFIGASGPFEPDLQMGAMMAWLNQCFSQGALRLSSVDPRVDPSIDINLLADPSDRAAARVVLRRVAGLTHDPAFEGIVVSEPAAADGTPVSTIERMSDAEVEAWLPSVVRDVSHLSGTCRMGDPDDRTTVVDPQCRVLGFEALRVIDAAVFPRICRSNLGFPTMMLAERMADVLRGIVAIHG